MAAHQSEAPFPCYHQPRCRQYCHVTFGPRWLSWYGDSPHPGRSVDRIQFLATFSVPVQPGPDAQSAPCTTISAIFPRGLGSGKCVGLTAHPYLAQMLKKESNCAFTPLLGLRCLLQGDLYLYFSSLLTVILSLQ